MFSQSLKTEIAPTEDRSLHQRLKDGTHDIHEALHAHEVLRPLLTPSLSFEQYKQILCCFYQFYYEQEARFSKFYGIFQYEAQPLTWLLQDFRAHGILPPEHQDLTQRENVTFEDYIGYLYVKQGSMLGGQVISAALKKNLNLDKEQSLFFYNGYGKKTGSVWRAFLDFLHEHESDINNERVLESAINTFSVLQDILDQRVSSECF